MAVGRAVKRCLSVAQPEIMASAGSKGRDIPRFPCLCTTIKRKDEEKEERKKEISKLTKQDQEQHLS